MDCVFKLVAMQDGRQLPKTSTYVSPRFFHICLQLVGGKTLTLQHEQLSVIPEASNCQTVGIYCRVS